MPNPSNEELNVTLGLLVAGVLTLGAFFLLTAMVQIHLRMGREAALMFSAVVTAAAVGVGIYEANVPAGSSRDLLLAMAAAPLLVLIGVPLALKIYGAWIGANLTPEEATPGSVGFRAWLSPLKLGLVAIVALSASQVCHVPFVEALGIALLLLLIYPVGNSLVAAPQVTPAAADLGPERERVLSMLESGRITADESAELLSALTATAQAPAQVAPASHLSTGERRALAGAALVLISFFLPWYNVDPAKEMQRLMGTLSGAMQQTGGPLPAGLPMGNLKQMMEPSAALLTGQNGPGIWPATSTITLSGGDIPHGLGWLVLFCALGAALLPWIGRGLEEQVRRLVTVLALGAGAIVLLYLVSSGVHYLGGGLILATGGYFIEFLALIRPSPAGSKLPRGVAVGM